MDDALKSVINPDIGKTICLQLIEAARLGGFKLTKFVSNNKEILDAIPVVLVSPATNINVDGNNQHLIKALGVKWKVGEDKFCFNKVIPDRSCTKRDILKVISSIFDPLGFLSPFIITAKIILQEIWKNNIKWDDENLSSDFNPFCHFLHFSKRSPLTSSSHLMLLFQIS